MTATAEGTYVVTLGAPRPDPDWNEWLSEVGATFADGAITDIDTRIDYYLEKILAGENERMRNVATAKGRINMIEDWRAGENAKIERRRMYLVGQIGMLAPPDVEAMEAEHGRKSRSLPHGKFGFGQQGDKVEIEDAKAALAFALTNNLTVETKHHVTKTALKNYAQSAGVIEGPGWELVVGQSEFFVSPSK